MTDAKPIFLDTNVLLAATDSSRATHAACHALIESGLQGVHSIFTSGQVIREYLVVATRPLGVNGLGMAPGLALRNITSFKQCIQLLDETQQVSNRLTKLIAQHQLQGKRIHDANIAATMLENGITQLKTLNPGDYTAFESIAVGLP